MIITLIFVMIFIIGIIIAHIIEKHNIWKDWLTNCGLSSLVIGAIGTLICISYIIFGHCCIDKQISLAQMQYESLQARVEAINSDYEDVSKSDVIQDVTEWNQDLYSKKYYASNPWTNWFVSQRYVNQFNYIDLPTFEGR